MNTRGEVSSTTHANLSATAHNVHRRPRYTVTPHPLATDATLSRCHSKAMQLEAGMCYAMAACR